MARTLLDQLREDTVLDIDANDAQVAELHKPFCNMTSNQAIALAELSKPQHQEAVQAGARQALKALEAGSIKEADLAQYTVDCMTIQLGLLVLPHLDPKGFLLPQTLPSLADSVEGTVNHAIRLVRAYKDVGVPSDRVCIKVPSSVAGLRACKELKQKHNINTLATTVFSVEQALAGADAGVVYVAPYVNPLRVHFVPGTHIKYSDPLSSMPGHRVTAEIQRVFRRRNISTKVMSASLITPDEVIALSGVDNITISPALLTILAGHPIDDHYSNLRARALNVYSPDYEGGSDDFPSDVNISADEPATALTAKLTSSPVKDLMEEALFHFGKAEKDLLTLAEQTLQKLRA